MAGGWGITGYESQFKTQVHTESRLVVAEGGGGRGGGDWEFGVSGCKL